MITTHGSSSTTQRDRWNRWANQPANKEFVAFLRSYWHGIKDGTEQYPNRFLDRLVEDARNCRRFTTNEVAAGIRTMERRRGAQRATEKKRMNESTSKIRPEQVKKLDPFRPRPAHREPAQEGLYRTDSGRVFVIRESKKNPGRRYARELVETPPRLAKDGSTVNWDFVGPAPGMVFRLTEGERITDPDEMAAIAIQTGKCARCGHSIWRDKSVRRMYGTRCWKRLTGTYAGR